jgi:histidinol-phosphate aminotransferase
LFRTVPWIEEIFPTDANFILARVDNAPERYRQLLERGIVVRNRSGLPLCENTLRITVGTPEENKFLINVIKAL